MQQLLGMMPNLQFSEYLTSNFSKFSDAFLIKNMLLLQIALG